MRRTLCRTLFVAAALAAVSGAALLWYAASDRLPAPAAFSILQSVMPAYDVQEVHATHVDAPPARAYAAILRITPGDVALARAFMWVRLLPARLAGGSGASDAMWERPLLSVPNTAILGRVPDREVVVGLIGQFWKLRAGDRIPVHGRGQFVTFRQPGFAVATLSFHVEPEAGGSRVTTITRVRTTDAESRRAFLRYWGVIGTGSAVLRRTWLRAVKSLAERQPQ